jgi:hypothetical protein
MRSHSTIMLQTCVKCYCYWSKWPVEINAFTICQCVASFDSKNIIFTRFHMLIQVLLCTIQVITVTTSAAVKNFVFLGTFCVVILERERTQI